jgi:hypothetical protein
MCMQASKAELAVCVELKRLITQFGTFGHRTVQTHAHF